jgi:hypothetical protein
MPRLAVAVFVALLVPAICEAKKPHCTLRAHVQANSNDGPVFSTQLRSPATGRNVVIEKTPTLSERDVISFRPYPAADGSYGVLFHLSDHGKLALETLSLEKRGTFLYVFVNGRPAAELQIDRRISDGKLYIASGLTLADIELMKKDWPLAEPRRTR